MAHQNKSLSRRVEAALYSTPAEIFVYIMIILSVAGIALEVSKPELVETYPDFFNYSEAIFIVFFTIEYFAKFAVAQDKWLFFRRYFIDLLAILPFLRFFRLFRGFRILRLLRVVRLLRLGNMIARRLSTFDGAGDMREAIIIFVVFLSTVFAGSIGILMFERTIPDTHFKTFGDGLWWCLVTITTVGYGDKYPQSPEGKVLGGVIMLVGLSFYGLVAGLGSNFIINRLKKGNEWMISTFTNHVIVLGVNEKLPRIVNLLLDMGHQVAIVTDDVDRVPQYPEHLVAIVEGDFVMEKTLEKARVEASSSAIILADIEGRTPRDADARSVLAALAIERIKPEVKTVVESLGIDTAFHLQSANVDDIIQSGGMTAEILAFSTDHAGYADHLKTLLRFVHQHRIVEDPVPQRLEGKTLYDIQGILANEQKILLGVRRGGEDSLDPDLVLGRGDTLINIEIL